VDPLAQPYLIVVRNGPTWDLDGLVFLAEVLSRKYAGEIWTFFHNAPSEEYSVGSFQIRRYRVFTRWSPAGRLAHILRLILRALRLRWLKGHRLVVITYDPLSNGIVGVVLKYLAGARFVCEVNGVYDDPNNLVDFENKEAARKKSRKMKWVSSRVLSRADHIKLLFPGQVDGYKGIPASIRQAAFANLVDFRRFEFVRVEQEAIFLFIGYPFLRKGVDVLLRAFSRILPDFPGWRLIVIGFRNENEAKRRNLPVDSVEFLEPQPQEEISRWLERCSALILPSRSEAMGRVLIEAALKGRARLGSRVGGIPHYISDDVDGLLFRPDDVDDMEATLRRFLTDDRAPTRLGEAARARAEAESSPEAYLEAYTEIISGISAEAS
jgi:glycosyltransferase involved in cell wall biosynthesis